MTVSGQIRQFLFKQDFGITLDPALVEAQDSIIQVLGPEHYYNIYKKSEHTFWWKALAWMDELRGFKSILDIGPAYGTLLVYSRIKSPEAEIFAIDCVNHLNEEIKNKFRITTIHGDIERNNFDVRPMDLIIFTEILEHLNFHPLATLLKIKDMLNPDGYILLSTPDAKSEWGRVEDSYKSVEAIPKYTGKETNWVDKHVYQYKYEELEVLFKQVGLKILKYETTARVGRWSHLFLLGKM